MFINPLLLVRRAGLVVQHACAAAGSRERVLGQHSVHPSHRDGAFRPLLARLFCVVRATAAAVA